MLERKRLPRRKVCYSVREEFDVLNELLGLALASNDGENRPIASPQRPGENDSTGRRWHDESAGNRRVESGTPSIEKRIQWSRHGAQSYSVEWFT